MNVFKSLCRTVALNLSTGEKTVYKNAHEFTKAWFGASKNGEGNRKAREGIVNLTCGVWAWPESQEPSADHQRIALEFYQAFVLNVENVQTHWPKLYARGPV